jgi:peptidoglycan/xylan/chitin deacetylase (PgdA/CDA1 family)
VRSSALRLVTQNRWFERLLDRLEWLIQPPANTLAVLTYHRVGEATEPGCYARIMVRPAHFDQQLAYLAAHHTVLSMPDLLAYQASGKALPPRAALITFDDAYTDFAEQAWPILQRHRLPVTLFVPTGFPDHPERTFWWDWLYRAATLTARREPLTSAAGYARLATQAEREQAFRQWRAYAKRLPHQQAMDWVAGLCAELGVDAPHAAVLGWAALRQLAAAGVTLGAHTQTHPLLNRVSLDEIRAEVRGSLADLRREIGSPCPVFAYPSGGCNEAVVSIVREEGVALAFTTQRGVNQFGGDDPLRLRRINVSRQTTLPLLRAQLLGFSTLLRAANRRKPGSRGKQIAQRTVHP